MKSDSRFSWRLGGKYSQLYTDGTYVEVVAPEFKLTGILER